MASETDPARGHRKDSSIGDDEALSRLPEAIYHRFVGCRLGTCAVTATPLVSTLYGARMGYLPAGGFAR